MERSLRERRERADLLDVVPEELDAKRLAARAREHVDEPAAHGDLPALLDALHALVARQRELLDERVELAGIRRRQAHDIGSRVRGWHALGERARGDTHDPAGGEHLESAFAFSDEVSGRLEAGGHADTPARQERDARGVDVPPDRLGHVARLLVLGEQAGERAATRRVKRREEERQRRLGHPRVRRERVCERTEALARGELLDEPGEGSRCRVHAAGGNRVPRGDRSGRRLLVCDRATAVTGWREWLIANARNARPKRPPNAPRGTPVSLLRPYLLPGITRCGYANSVEEHVRRAAAGARLS